MYTPSYDRDQKEAGCPTLYHVSRVSSVVLMGRETSSLQLLASLLLTEGKESDLMMRGNIVLNKTNSLMPLIIYCAAPGRLSSPVLSRSGHSNGVASLGTPARPGPSKQAHVKGRKAIGPFPTSKPSQKKSTFQCPVSSLAHPFAQSVWYFAILGRLPGSLAPTTCTSSVWFVAW
jgi:hypothetical protein